MKDKNVELDSRKHQFFIWYCSTKAYLKYSINNLDFRINKNGTFEVYITSLNQKIYGRRK